MANAYQHDAGPAGFKTAGSNWTTLGARINAGVQTLFHLPPAAASRVFVVFTALALVKLALLAQLGKHLHEIHWRVSGTPLGWASHWIFFAFVGLGVWSLVAMGRQCQPVGLPAVRMANLLVLSLASLFIFLTFHEGDNNYLYPVMTGTLGWTSLGPYLSLSLFFRPPFLAAWLIVYVLLYYLFVRSNRERWVLHLTAGFAGAYGLLYLQEFAWYRNELAVAGCFGLAGLLFLRRPDHRLHAAWLLAPLTWIALAVAIFYAQTPSLRDLNPYLVLLAGVSAVLFAGATLLAKGRGFLAVWIKLAPFYFTGFFLLSSANYPMSANYNNLLCYAFQFPHYFAGELVLIGVLALAAALYCRWQPGASLWWLDVLGLALVVMALVDFRLSQVMGVRLDWDLLSFGHSPAMMWRMALPYLAGLAWLLGLSVLAYAIAVRGAQIVLGRNRDAAGALSRGRGGRYVATCFALLAVSGLIFEKSDNAKGHAVWRLIETSPWWKRASERPLRREEFLSSATVLGMGDFERAQPDQPIRPRRELNVVLVLMESSYNRHLSLFSGTNESQPLLSQYKDRMEIFPNFFCNYAGSIHARFAVFTSLYPAKDYNLFTLKRVGVKSLFEVLHENEYACSMFYSSFFDYTGFRDFLKYRGLEMFDADTMPGQRTTKRVSWGLREEEVLNAIRQRIQQHAVGNEKFFLTYVPAAPHYPYDSMPEKFRKHKLKEYMNYTPLFLNELLYMDWVIASILDQLKESGLLDRTLVIITSDHGEMLGENRGELGHGWAVTPELANVPLIIMDPSKLGYRLNTTVGSQVDLLPTALDLLGIPVPAGELYQGRSLYAGAPEANRLIYLNSYRQYGVISGRKLVLGDRSGEAGGPSDNARTTYLISNDGSKTVFTEDREVVHPRISIQKFDQFQESLLQNYSFYRDSNAKAGPGSLLSVKP